jgi:hypothetical protein
MIRVAHPSAKERRNRVRRMHALSEGLILSGQFCGPDLRSELVDPPILVAYDDGFACHPVCPALWQSQFDFFPVLAGSGARATPQGSYFLSGSGMRSSADL